MITQVVVVNITTIRSRQRRPLKTRLRHVKMCKLDGDIFCRVMPNVSPYKLSKCSIQNDIHNKSVFLVSSGIQSLFMNLSVIIEIVLLVSIRAMPNWLMMVQSWCPPTGIHVDKWHYSSYQPCSLLFILLNTFCLNTDTVFHAMHTY
jgi:hypothetical protein